MNRREIEKWNENRWEAEFNALMETARKHTRADAEATEVIVLKTVKDNVYTAVIPDFYNPETREPIENACINTLAEKEDTEVFCCVALVNGTSVEIPSWNFRKKLLEINPKNLDTELLLQGPGVYLVKPLRATLPPKKPTL